MHYSAIITGNILISGKLHCQRSQMRVESDVFPTGFFIYPAEIRLLREYYVI